MENEKPAFSDLPEMPPQAAGTPLADLDLPDPTPAPVEPVIVERTNWIATIGVGLTLLVLGFGAGFSARPLLIPAPAPVVAPPAAGTPGSGGSMLDLIYGSVRHYRGDPKAPVTMLEYSDFQ